MSNLEMKVNALMRLVASEDAVSYDTAKAEVLRLMGEGNSQRDMLADPEAEISKVLLELGMPQHILGYQYIVAAIRLAVEDPKIINRITDGLYPAVASVCGSTPSRVERSIRHAIEITWDRGELEVLGAYFGNTISPARGKPTNSEFIARISNHIRRRADRFKIVS